MARKSIVELINQANVNLPDNTSGLISAADVRDLFVQFLEAIRPAYGRLSRTLRTAFEWGIAEQTVTFDAAIDSFPSESTSSTSSNTIARSERGTSRITLEMNIEAPTNISCNLVVYKDLTAIGAITAVGRGTNNPVGINMVILDYADPAATYSVKASAEADTTTIYISNAAFLIEIVPVNSFT